MYNTKNIIQFHLLYFYHKYGLNSKVNHLIRIIYILLFHGMAKLIQIFC